MSSGEFVCTNPAHAELQEENERLETEMKELQLELEEKSGIPMPSLDRQKSNAELADGHLKSVIRELQNTIDGLEMQNSAAELSETEVISLRGRCTDLTSKIRELENTIDGLEQLTLGAEDAANEAIILRTRLAERDAIESELRAKIEQYEGKLENLHRYDDGAQSREQIEFLMSKIEELQNTIDGLEQQNLAAEAFSVETSELRSRVLEMNRKISQFSGEPVFPDGVGSNYSHGGVIDYRLELEKQYEREKAYKRKIVELKNTIDGLELQQQGAEMVVRDAEQTYEKLKERNSVIGELQNIIGGLELQSLAAEGVTKESDTLKKELRQRRNTEFNLNNKIVELENTIDGLELQTRGAEVGMRTKDGLEARVTELETMLTKENPHQEYLHELQSEMNDVRNAMRILNNENRELLDEIDELRNRSDTDSERLNEGDVKDLLTRINILEQRQKEKELDWGIKEKRGREMIESYQTQIRKLELEKTERINSVERLERQLDHLQGSIQDGGPPLPNEDGNVSDNNSSHLSVEVEVAHYRRESAYLRDECEALMEELEELKAQFDTPDQWEPPAMILPKSKGVVRPTMTDAELSTIKTQIQRELDNIRASASGRPGAPPPLISAPTVDDEENNLPPDHPDFEDAYDELLISPSLEKSVKFEEGTQDGRPNKNLVRANTRTSWGQQELNNLKRDMVLEMNMMVKRELRDMMDSQDNLRWIDEPAVQPAANRESEEAAVLDAATALVSGDSEINSAMREELNKIRQKLKVAEAQMERMGQGADKFTEEYDALQNSLEESKKSCSDLKSKLTEQLEENERLARRKLDLEDDVQQMDGKMKQSQFKLRDMEETIQTVVASKLRLVQTTSEEIESLRGVIRKLAMRGVAT